MDSEVVTVELIGQAAQAGDDLALDLVHSVAVHLGTAIANLVNLFNPEVIILGGLVSRWGGVLMDAIREEAAKRALAIAFRRVQIVPSQADDVAVPLGAAAQVLTYAGELLAVPSA